MTATHLTVSGLAVALTLIALNARAWWRAGKRPKDAGPFLGGLALGALMAACTGGILKWVAGLTAAGTNTIGSVATGGIGASGGAIAPAPTAGLTPGGAIIVVAATALGAVAVKAASKTITWRLAGGIVVGASLAIAAGPSGLLDSTLYAAANSIGDWIIGWANGSNGSTA